MPETPHVISEDLVLFRKFRDLVIPHIQIVGEAVNQDQIFSFPAQGIVHLDSISLYFHGLIALSIEKFFQMTGI
jgi:hypothetical protein